MYGMVNKAVREMVVAQHGLDSWEAILLRAGVKEPVFLSSKHYPDAVTFQLVAAACEHLEEVPAEFLRRFGHFWVLETARKGYGSLMEAGGNTLHEFLFNLPNFHNRIALLFPDLVPPTFHIAEVKEQSLVLQYASEREGLAPFVVGLIEGLSTMFSEPVRITHRATKASRGRDEFLIVWEPSS